MDDLAKEALFTLFGEILLGAIIVFVTNRKHLNKFLIDSCKILHKTLKELLIK